MAKRQAMLDGDETGELWPELNLVDPKHKAVFSAAKKFYKENAARKALLGESKAKVDACRDRLIELMHGAKLEKFKFRGLVVEIWRGEESAEVKIDDDVDVDEGED